MSAWNEPEGATPRGTLVLLAGRGESADVYGRFGRRISADAYRVRVVEHAELDASAATAAALALLEDDTLPSPKVLVGSDAGAVLALSIAAAHPSLAAAVIVAGVPVGAATAGGDDASLRSACPVHAKVIADDTLITQGALSVELPASLVLPDASAVTVPVLAIHGEADAVSPLLEALPYLLEVPGSRVLTVAGGRHDVLNDLTHRSVAASIVLFLERLRLLPPPSLDLPVVLTQSSARGLVERV
jgi:pimeloyl-ACP methyl ester carboxylesterase